MTVHRYNHHIGDLRSACAHLSDAEELAYRRLIEVYYDLEEPIPDDPEWIARHARCSVEVARRLLTDFFVRDEARGVWRQARCDKEIAAYRRAVRLARTNGKLGGRPPKRTGTEPEPDGNRSGSNPGANGGARKKASRKLSVSPSPHLSVQPPNPPSGGRQGVDASQEGEEARDPVVQIQQALLGTSLRSKLRPLHRGRQLMELATRVHPTGITAEDVANLWTLAQEQGGDPGALLAHWLDQNLWREVLDGEHNRAKERDAASRARTSGDPMEGVYGA